MNQYQKVYMNQIHSSSLLGQLAQMWRSQMLCDALIRTGNITTKAHRVVLVAACPMLQSMDNASVGSHLEVRLAADIKQEAVNSFLQYLYEGFMMLTEENCKDVEKVARLLQVDSVTKCCIDFYNCLQKKTGVPVYSNTQYKYSSADLVEFRHVRTTDLQKTIHERMMKRAAADSMRPMSPGGKRQRTQQRPPSPNIDLAMFGQKADDTLSMAHSYMGNQGADPWERVPRHGAVHGQRPTKPGVIEIVEDSLEILQTQPPDKDGNKSAPPIVQKSMAISVSSQINQSSDVHIVNVNDTSSHPTAATDGPIMSTGRDSITVSPLTVMPGSSSSSISSPLTKDPHKPPYDSQKELSDRAQLAKKSQSLEHTSTPQQRLFPVSMSPANMSPISQVSQPKKSFAAGSASQAASMSQSQESPSISKRPSSSTGSEIIDRPPSSDSGKDLGAKSKLDDGSASNSTDMAPDLSIVKVEPTIDDPGLDMYVDVPDDSMIQGQQRDKEHDDESDLEVEEASGDWSRDEMSNETGGNDPNNSWYIGQFKGQQIPGITDERSFQRTQGQFSNNEQFARIHQGNSSERFDTNDDFHGYEATGFQQEDPKVEVVAAWYTESEDWACRSSEGWTCSSEYETGHEHPVVGIEYVDDIKGEQENHAQYIRHTESDGLAPQPIHEASYQEYNTVNSTQMSDKVVEQTKKNDSSAENKDIIENPKIITSRYAMRKASVVGCKRVKSVIAKYKNQMPKGNKKDVTEKNDDKKQPANPFKRKTKGSSFIEKYIPSKASPMKDFGKRRIRRCNQKSAPTVQNKTRNIPKWQKYFTNSKVKVVDRKFWSIPCRILKSSLDKKDLFGSSNVFEHFDCAPFITKAGGIPDDLVKDAMTSSGLRRNDFAMTLLHNILSVGDVYGIIHGGDDFDYVNSFKVKMVKKLTFNLFPIQHETLAEKKWGNVLVLLRRLKFEIRSIVQNCFDTKAI